eukprot:3940639-Prymnesium_polylepis.1
MAARARGVSADPLTYSCTAVGKDNKAVAVCARVSCLINDVVSPVPPAAAARLRTTQARRRRRRVSRLPRYGVQLYAHAPVGGLRSSALRPGRQPSDRHDTRAKPARSVDSTSSDDGHLPAAPCTCSRCPAPRRRLLPVCWECGSKGLQIGGFHFAAELMDSVEVFELGLRTLPQRYAPSPAVRGADKAAGPTVLFTQTCSIGGGHKEVTS